MTDETEDIKPQADETATGAAAESPAGGTSEESAAAVDSAPAEGVTESASAEEKVKAAEAKDEPATAQSSKPAGKPTKGAQPDAPRVVRAQAKYVRTSARKARLVCDNIRGKSVVEARAILTHTPRAAARDWSKLLESAVANAEHNHELVGEDLVIKAVSADEGPTMKRFRPRAQGRAARIRKRTAHLTILLTPKN